MAQELCRHKVSAVSFAGNQQARYTLVNYIAIENGIYSGFSH
jgi:hypothetical protein